MDELPHDAGDRPDASLDGLEVRDAEVPTARLC